MSLDAPLSLFRKWCLRKRRMRKAVQCWAPLVQSWVGAPLQPEQSWLFAFFHLPVVPPEVFLPRQILDTKWESVIQKNTNHLWSNVTAETMSHM